MSLLPKKELKKIYKYKNKLDSYYYKILLLKDSAPHPRINAKLNAVTDEILSISNHLSTSCPLEEQIHN